MTIRVQRSLMAENNLAKLDLFVALDDEALQEAIDEDSNLTFGELARQFHTSSEMVRLLLHRLGKMYMSCYQWAKRSLRTSICSSWNIHLHGKSFTNEADVHQALTDFFASLTHELYRKGI
ncbi:histone-lysine N-methyltransferase SETMAR [Trichonephila clavipes]|nr:histone-lysine N-methyltransferase SETMAR [Trichonephila clavipes]